MPCPPGPGVGVGRADRTAPVGRRRRRARAAPAGVAAAGGPPARPHPGHAVGAGAGAGRAGDGRAHADRLGGLVRARLDRRPRRSHHSGVGGRPDGRQPDPGRPAERRAWQASPRWLHTNAELADVGAPAVAVWGDVLACTVVLGAAPEAAQGPLTPLRGRPVPGVSSGAVHCVDAGSRHSTSAGHRDFDAIRSMRPASSGWVANRRAMLVDAPRGSGSAGARAAPAPPAPAPP